MTKWKKAIYDTVVKWGDTAEKDPYGMTESTYESCPLCVFVDYESPIDCLRCPVVKQFYSRCMSYDAPFDNREDADEWTNHDVFIATCFLAAMEGVEI